jgi:cobalt-zinc-cadmium efflux system protein
MHMSASTGKNDRRLRLVLKLSMALTAAYIAGTFIFGLRAHSLALISEAGHNVSDLLAILLSFLAVFLQSRPANDRKTFGYQRAGVLAAFVNAVTLIVLSGWIAIEAIGRLHSPVIVQPRLMMIVATFGVLMNGAVAGLLWRFSRDVNIRSVFIHMLGDTLSTAAVIAGGAGIAYTGLTWIDPVLSLIIAGLILWSSAGIVKETFNILLEGTPKGLQLAEIRAAIQKIPGVLSVHDLHVWSLTTDSHALASHITIGDRPLAESRAILKEVNHALEHRFRIHHTTIQFEATDCSPAEGCCNPPRPVEETCTHNHSH